MSTHFETREDSVAARKWVEIDADGKVVGRLASEIAQILRGKNNPLFAPHTDNGDFVVVINAEKIRFTGKKWEDKVYYHHTGYVGGLKSETAGELRDRQPDQVLKKAVWGMLPKTPLGRSQFKKLKIYTGETHPHQSQFSAAGKEQ